MIGRNWLGYLTGAVAGVLIATAVPAATQDLSAYSWTEQYAGTALNLSGYALTFSDEFNKQSVTPDGGAGPWYAPVHGNYGVARFDVPGPANQTYSISNGQLNIRATKAADGTWHGGNVETINQAGKGFAQKYGYFEARMKFPAMLGAWPAFWLKSQAEHTNPAMVRPEIDVVEWYGGDPAGVHSSMHLWPPAAQYLQAGMLSKPWAKSSYSKQANLTDQWHTYGALVAADFVTIYVDRVEVGRFPTLDEFKTALYPLVSLTLYDKDAAKAVSPFDLQVDYVRIYSRGMPNPPTDVRAK